MLSYDRSLSTFPVSKSSLSSQSEINDPYSDAIDSSVSSLSSLLSSMSASSTVSSIDTRGFTIFFGRRSVTRFEPLFNSSEVRVSARFRFEPGSKEEVDGMRSESDEEGIWAV